MSEIDESTPREPISVYEHIAQIVNAMATISWQKLGLQPDMATGKIAQDLDEAKVAIDVTAYLVSTLEHELDEDDRRRIHSIVRDLRINYVQKAKESGT